MPTVALTLAPTLTPTDEPLGAVEETLPPDVEDTLEKAQSVAEVAGEAAAVGALAGAGAAAGPAMRLVVAGALCKVGEQVGERAYPRALHPTQWKILDSQAAGMVVGNFFITLGFWMVMMCVVKIISTTNIIETMDTLGLCRFPSAPLFVFQFLLQGTSLGAMMLVFYTPSPQAFVIGLSALLFCMAVPIFLIYKVSKGVPQLAYYQTDPETEQRVWLKALIGPGEWVSKNQDDHWAFRYAVAVRPFRQGWACFAFVEMAGSLAIAAVQASNAQSLVGCGHKKLCAAIVFLVLLIVEAVTWPRARVRDNWLTLLALFVQVLAMTCMAVGYYAENLEHTGFVIGANLLIVAVAVLLLKTALDLLSELYILVTRRRARLQRDQFARSRERKELFDARTDDDDKESSAGLSNFGSNYGSESFLTISDLKPVGRGQKRLGNSQNERLMGLSTSELKMGSSLAASYPGVPGAKKASPTMLPPVRRMGSLQPTELPAPAVPPPRSSPLTSPRAKPDPEFDRMKTAWKSRPDSITRGSTLPSVTKW